MANNFIDLIYSKNAIDGLKEAHTLLGQTHDDIVKISKLNIDFFGGKSAKNPAEMQKVIADFGKIEKANERVANAVVRNAERQRLAELKLASDRDKAFARAEAQHQKEMQRLNAAQNLYNRTQQQLNLVQQAYNNLAVKKERYNNLTAQEEARLATLGRVTEKYNATLKAVDATVGKHTRNVGNYASGFNPLSNSINQLTREMPAFTYSVQTGFMALSNNIPIFSDAIGNAIRQNKELIAQGQPVKSVLSQVAGALLSWQTLMGVGITLLTVYGKEIGIWVAALFGASDALDELNKRQKEFNNTRITGKKDAQSDIIELKKYLAVVKDRKLSDEERNIALKQLRSQYPFYFKNLTDEQILTGKTAEAQNRLNTALEKRKQVEKGTELNVANKQKLIDLNEERDVQEKILLQTQKQLSLLLKRDSVRPEALAAIGDKENKTKERLIELDAEIQKYTEAIIKNDGTIIRLKGETIGLEYQEDKQRQKKIKQLKELTLADIPASEFALMQAILNAEISNNQKIYENEKKTNEERSKSFELLQMRKMQLATLEMNEEIRLEEKASAALLSQKGLSEKQKQDLITQSNINIQKIEFDHAQKVIGITADTVGKIKELYDRVSNQAKLNIIDQQELDDLRQLNLLLSNLTIESDLKRYKSYEKLKVELSKNTTERRLEHQLRIKNAEIEAFDVTKDNVEALNKLKGEQIAIEKALASATNSRLEVEAEKTKQLIINTQSYFKEIQAGFLDKGGLGSLNFFLKLDENGKSTFDRLIEGADSFGQKAAIAFNGLADVAQEAFAFINQQSEMRFQAEFDRLENQKNIAIRFAGDSATAKEEIERQYEKKRQEIERRKLQQQKKASIFNIIIDTAQAVVSALAEVSFPANIAVAALFAGIGAAQIAMVNSQQIPAYAEGTENHPGGRMLINDGKGSNYKETVVTPDGKATQYNDRNVLLNKPKGTKVYTPEQWHKKQLDEMLFFQGIFMSKNISESSYSNNGLSKSDFDNGINKLSRTISERESLLIIKDAKGERLFEKKQGQMKELLNSRLKIKSFHV
jgi:hypothetical protein